VIDGANDVRQLNFGWYESECDGDTRFRWSSARASAFFRLRKPMITCTIAFAGSKNREARMMVRPLGNLEPCLDESF
jgi:hypothetical protein